MDDIDERLGGKARQKSKCITHEIIQFLVEIWFACCVYALFYMLLGIFYCVEVYSGWHVRCSHVFIFKGAVTMN